MNFQHLQLRLVEKLRRRVHCGEDTERGLARRMGISQPHLHNVLNGTRVFSMATADEILKHLHMDVLDLVDADEWNNRPPGQ